MTLIRRLPTWTILPLLLGALFASGCDGGGSKRASRAQQLSGTWDIQCVYAGAGCKDPDAQISFSDGERKTFRLIRDRASEPELEGTAELLSSNALGMTAPSLPGPLVWRLDFEKPDPLPDSVRLTLEPARDDAVQAFLDALGVSGTTGRIELDLVPPSS